MRPISFTSPLLRPARLLGRAQADVGDRMRRLSTGLRIERASDDAAGLAVAARMRARVRSLGQASRNGQAGYGALQVAEGALSEVAGTVLRLRELAVQAATGTLDDAQRGAIQKEVQQILAEVDRVGATARFGDMQLLDGSLDAGGGGSPTAAVVTAPGAQIDPLAKKEKLTFDDFGIFAGLNGAQRQISLDKNDTQADVVAAINADPDIGSRVTASVDAGKLVLTSNATGETAQFRVSSNRSASGDQTGVGTTPLLGGGTAGAGGGGLVLQLGIHSDPEDTLTLQIAEVGVDALGLAGLDLSTQGGALAAIAAVDASLQRVSEQRSDVGVALTRVRHAIDQVEGARADMASAQSRIEDLDVAEASAGLARALIKRDAGAAAVAHANLAPQALLRLL